MSRLTVFSVIRNGILNGYPFVEAYASWFGYCDRVVVLDGQSTDGTRAVLRALRELEPRLELATAPWPTAAAGGTAIAQFTNEALRIASRGTERLMYVQADEIYDEPQRRLVQDRTDRALEFEGCVNFWNSMDRVLANEFPLRYLRSFAVRQRPRAIGDGFSFDVAEGAVTRTPERFLHYGWCFPVNILQKHINHAQIYRDTLPYVIRGRLARRMLERGVFDPTLLDALAPNFVPVPFDGEHPACVRHLVGRRVYDPYVGLELLRSGAVW